MLVECSVIGSPLPLITWSKLTPVRVVFLSSQTVLTLQDVDNETSGQYECVADNGVDKVLRKTIAVAVHGRQIKRLLGEGSKANNSRCYQHFCRFCFGREKGTHLCVCSGLVSSV